MQRRSESQVFRDPIYGNITVKYEVITNIINSPEFQRLRRIRQLAGVSMIYHGAEHSRFSHSLGVYHLATQFLKNAELSKTLDEREKLLFLSTALLHDIGHGPYSHAFEQTFKTNHELLGTRVIKESNYLRKVLDKVDDKFAEDIADIILGVSDYPIIEQLISSQLDVDRLDYLLRDTYYTGALFGNVDIDRIIHVMRIIDGKVVFKEGGLSAIENYLISRYHMYWQVYYHHGTRAYELVLEKIYLRIKYILDNNIDIGINLDIISKIIKDPNNLEYYLKIDDYYIHGLVSQFTNCSDLILQTLSNDFVNRNIWNYAEVNSETEREVLSKMTDDEIEYYTATQTAYEQTYKDETKALAEQIYILEINGDVKTLATKSPIIKSLIESGNKTDRKFFYRK